MFKLFLLIILLVLLRFYINCNSFENFDENKLLNDLEDIKKNCLIKGKLDESTIAALKGPKGDLGGKTMAYFPLVNGSAKDQYFYYKTNGPVDYSKIVQGKNPDLFKPPYMWAFTDENTFKCQYDNNLDLKNKDNEIILDKNVKNPLKFRRTDKNTYIDTESNKCLTNSDNKITLKDCIKESQDISSQQWYFQF
jgi:hypothetical protein